MRRDAKGPSALVLCAALALTACGSGARTVTAGGPPATASAGTTAAKRAAPAPTAPPAAGTSSGPAGGQAPSSTTHTAPAPAFVEQEAHPEGALAAAAVLRAHGFKADKLSEYHADQTLRVLIGTRTPTGDGYGQRAFFFLGGRYLGTDTKEPSASLRIVSQSDTEIVLAYPLYRHQDPLCCPGGGQAIVHFQLNDGKLVPLQPIPPESSKTGLSRY
jgi:hypothetical protein